MSNPKKHHYVPESYLSGFTLSEKKNDKLWVIDQYSATIRESTPKNEAHKRYFYKVAVVEGGDEFGIEKALSEFEGKSIPVLKDLIHNKRIPTNEDYDYLINYIALQIVRTPTFRKNFEESLSNVYDQLGKITLQMLVQSEEVFDKHIDDLIKRKPHLKEEEFDYEKIRRGIENITIKADIEQNYHIKHALRMIDNLLPHLGKRNWSVLLPPPKKQYFITSDNPVVLAWSYAQNFNRPIGYGLDGTDIIFPINKNIALLGRFEFLPAQINLSKIDLAKINNMIANYSDRYLYSCENEVVWYTPDGSIGDLSMLLKFIKEVNINKNS